jgi:mono/diheme cytochrome c family protein
MFKSATASALTLFALGLTGTAAAADLAAGKAKVDQICSECHEIADWKGKTEVDLQGKIKNVVSGKTQHKKKLQLTDEDIANIAAYWASAANK